MIQTSKYSWRLSLIVIVCGALYGCVATTVTEKQAATPTAPSYDAQHKVSEFMLKNGAKLVVKEDHRGPIAITQFWYRVGASDEYNGVTGISHALEHLMFKGTPSYPAEKLTATIKDNGGRFNAFTGTDYTAYYEIFSPDKLELSFAIESDRMINLTMREEDFDKEIEVVKEERRLRVEDKPRSKMWEKLYAVAFRNSPYGNPVIGWMDDLENMQLDDLRQWYKDWYTPSNLVIVVAGDVNPKDVYKLAQKYVEPIPATPTPLRKPRREVQTESTLRFQLKAVAKKPYLMMANRVPNVHSAEHEWEPFALAVLSGVLSGSANARFNKNLIRGKKLALHVGIAYRAYGTYDDLFIIAGTPLEGVSVAQLEQGIEEEIAALKKHGVEQEELERIKTGLLAHQVYSQDSLTHQAMEMGRFEIMQFGWKSYYQSIERFKEVTAEQVQEVAIKYLNKDKRIYGELIPQPPTIKQQ